MPWLTQTTDGVIISIHASPRASKTAVQGLHGDSLKIRLNAPPVDGKANGILIEFLADTLGIPERQVTIVGGETSRQKRVLVRGLTVAQVQSRLSA